MNENAVVIYESIVTIGYNQFISNKYIILNN